MSHIEAMLEALSRGPERWGAALDALEDFQTFLSDRVPTLSITEGCFVEKGKPDQRLDGCAVYLLFGVRGRLIYIGRTVRAIDERLRRHLRRFDCNHCDYVALPNGLEWLVFSLERFLIARLKPELNEEGIASNW